uniref:Uncharacterized protein n=1 Tax=Aegilops tauschii TaxID=37682 RepID=M8BAW7_AEGTA
MDDGYFVASSFQPPVVTRSSARYAPWVLLDNKAYFAVRKNATAEAVTSTGNAFKVTFCLADPPAISHFCVHGPEFQRDVLTTEPLVVSSVNGLVLLCFSPGRNRRGSRLDEYFVYKAHHRKPSLTPIPSTPPGTTNSFHVCILPLDDNDGVFVLADLCITVPPLDYELHLFSSKTGKWATTPLMLQTYPGVTNQDLPGRFFNKVIALGGGAVGWVNLWRGILTCNVFDKNPVLSFIPIPMLAYCDKQRASSPRLVQDLTCSNGYIKFVELELITQKSSVTRGDNLDSVDIIHDSELFFHNENARANKKKSLIIDACVGWKLRTCNRHTTWNYWRKGQPIDIEGIPVGNPIRFMLLPQLWNAAAERSTPRNQCSACPTTLGMDNEDVVYMMSKLLRDDKNAWMVGVNLGKKTTDVSVQ